MSHVLQTITVQLQEPTIDGHSKQQTNQSANVQNIDQEYTPGHQTNTQNARQQTHLIHWYEECNEGVKSNSVKNLRDLCLL